MPRVTVDSLAASLGGTVLGSTPGDAAPLVDLTHDSRDVGAGFLFACLPGEHFDGHDFARAAAEAGAIALMVERPVDVGVPQIVVGDVRSCLAAAAAEVHGHPSRRLATIGVTGTAGKTTVTHALADILTAAGRPCAVLGTLSGARTTPEAPDLQRWLAGRLAAGDRCAAIEVSSHALELGRADSIDFAAGVFTNLSPEHLDFHGTMDHYFAAKARLFDGRSKVAVINRDDEYGRILIDRIEAVADAPLETYGRADLTSVRLTSAGSAFDWRGHTVHSALVGGFNLLNLNAAGTTAVALGVDEVAVAEAMAAVAPVRGRMEPVPVRGADITVVVDYGHKPDALKVALEAAADFTDGRLWVVFGAGGDRDTAKRPMMGAAADEVADVAVVTSDNPRSEDPRQIIDAIVEAMDTPVIEPDRSAAIAHAIDSADPGDVVVVAGKGHETTQTTGSDIVPFDDVEVSRRHLEERVRRMGLAR
jgi:UDP-N-acetylmuramoyl-L-alanyl-D-glutamate--2,6-diaminopimelate ligase